jgi:hypothetical protein
LTDRGPETPPWKVLSSWNEANQTLDYLIAIHGRNLDRATRCARDFYRNLTSLFPLLEDLCRSTCPWCPDPCCISAYAWLDFKDLLFIHLNHLPVAQAQLMPGAKMTCRYLGNRGCQLERECRPWVCTWYLCPTQLGALKKYSRGEKAFFHETAAKIRRARKDMESIFINLTCLAHPDIKKPKFSQDRSL